MLIHEIDDVKEWISIYIHTFMYICIYNIAILYRQLYIHNYNHALMKNFAMYVFMNQ